MNVQLYCKQDNNSVRCLTGFITTDCTIESKFNYMFIMLCRFSIIVLIALPLCMRIKSIINQRKSIWNTSRWNWINRKPAKYCYAKCYKNTIVNKQINKKIQFNIALLHLKNETFGCQVSWSKFISYQISYQYGFSAFKSSSNIYCIIKNLLHYKAFNLFYNCNKHR